MGAFVSGVPENMLNFVMHERSRRTISILYNVCASGSTDKDSLIMRGMKVASICDYFEKCGYRVRIDVCDTASGYNNGTGAAWNLVFCAKDYGQSLDFGRIGFMMGSPAMLRRIFFGVEASSRLWRNTIGKTFGCVCPVFTHLGNQYDYVFDYNSPINSQSPDQVVEYILTGIANQKVDMSLIGGGE
jgi:hypothetical protein